MFPSRVSRDFNAWHQRYVTRVGHLERNNFQSLDALNHLFHVATDHGEIVHVQCENNDVPICVVNEGGSVDLR